MVDVRSVWRERRAAPADPADDDPERVDDRHAEDEQRDRHLGRPEDREHRQRVPDELDAARPAEDLRRVEVPAQEPGQRPGQREAQDRDERLADLRRQAQEPQGHRGDQRDPGRQAVEAVDPVDAVDHPDDPEDREPDRERLAEADHVVAERVVDDGDPDAEQRPRTPPSPIWPASCQRARRSNRSSMPPSAAAAAPPRNSARNSDGPRVSGVGTQSALALRSTNPPATTRKRRGDREAAGAWDRARIHAASIRAIDDAVAQHDPPDERRQDEREERGRDEDRHDRPDAVPDLLDESSTRVSSRGWQPRDREAVDDLGDLGGQPSLDGFVVAPVDRLDDDPPDRRASRPRRSHGTSWPACPGGCRMPCWAAAGRTGCRSC